METLYASEEFLFSSFLFIYPFFGREFMFAIEIGASLNVHGLSICVWDHLYTLWRYTSNRQAMHMYASPGVTRSSPRLLPMPSFSRPSNSHMLHIRLPGNNIFKNR
jgi:hypothetical protein